MGGGGGGGGQARASARQAEAQARTARLQSSIYESNAAFMADTLSFNLRSFDEQAGQALGSTALQLARSGNLSRAPRAMSNADQLGLDNEVPDPLETLRGEMGGKSDLLSQYDAFSSSITELHDQESEFEERISAIEEEYADVVADQEAADKRRSDRRERQRSPSSSSDDSSDSGDSNGGGDGDRSRSSRDRNKSGLNSEERRQALIEMEERIDAVKGELSEHQSKVQEVIDKRDELGVDDPGALRAEVETLQTQIDSIEEVINEVSAEAPEGIERQQALTFTAGSTHTQASKALQSLLVQRDKMFMGGISGVLQMTQNAMVADEQAEMSEQAARDYMDLADDMDFNSMLSTVFQGAGLLVGATAGTFIAPGLGTAGGAALGSQAGSFLGNAFAR